MTKADYKQLKDKWYAKLKNTGFVDHERANGRLIESEPDYRAASLSQRASIQQYYSNAKSVLHEYTFKNARQRQIWDLHTDGLSIRKIGKEIGLGRTAVHAVIQRIQRENKLVWKA